MIKSDLDINNDISESCLFSDSITGVCPAESQWSLINQIPSEGGLPEQSAINFDSSGDGFLIWTENTSLYARRFENGKWSGRAIISYFKGVIEDIELTIDNLGNAHVVWLEGSNIWYNSSSKCGGWVQAIKLGSELQYS